VQIGVRSVDVELESRTTRQRLAPEELVIPPECWTTSVRISSRRLSDLKSKAMSIMSMSGKRGSTPPRSGAPVSRNHSVLNLEAAFQGLEVELDDPEAVAETRKSTPGCPGCPRGSSR
jgi:hypothetical protein